MKKWSLNSKIIFVLSIFVVACFTISGIGLWKMGQINEVLDRTINAVAQRLNLARAMQYRIADIAGNQARAIVDGTKDGVQKYSKAIEFADDRTRKRIDDYLELALPAVKPRVEKFKIDYNEYHGLIVKSLQLIAEGKIRESVELTSTKITPLREELEKFGDELVEINQERMKVLDAEAKSDYKDAQFLMWGFSIAAILIGMGLAFVIMRAVNNSINVVISNLEENSNQVKSAAQQIAASSEQLSQAATEQASSLEETAASIEEMNSMVMKNTENAAKSASVSASSQAGAQRGQQVMQEVIQAIDAIDNSNNDIVTQINESNAQISEIVKVIAEIGNKTKVINDIVFQTKLLSFNASVEAARAGEHGKGFAVVAEEVGNLAQMSGNAAKEIASMLEGSILKVEGIVNDTKTKVERLITQGKEKVETGKTVAHECGKVLAEIVDNVGSVSQMANEISSASQEQAQGVQEINKAIGALDQVTQENASTSEEAASSAEELSAQADALRSVVQTLIVTIKGAKHAEAMGVEEYSAPAASKKLAKATPAKAAGLAKVMPIKSAVKAARKPTPSMDTSAELKKASGFKNGIPSDNDPRFEEV